MKTTLMLMLVAGLLAFAAPATAQTSNIDYVGFGWETGGIPASNPGDVLSLLAIAAQIDPIFGVDLDDEEVTVYIFDLESTGETPIGGGNVFIGYVNGMIEVWRDASKDHDWGINPPNPELNTWRNGTLMLEGEFDTFAMALTPQGAGSYEGTIDGIGGTVAQSCSDCVFTFGGAFTEETGAQLPEGYHIQVDGILEVLNDVSTTNSSFGAVKALYNQ